MKKAFRDTFAEMDNTRAIIESNIELNYGQLKNLEFAPKMALIEKQVETLQDGFDKMKQTISYK
jgi:hypothetical protein